MKNEARYENPVNLYISKSYDDAETAQNFIKVLAGEQLTVSKSRNGDYLYVSIEGSDEDIDEFLDVYKDTFTDIVWDCDADANGWVKPKDVYDSIGQDGKVLPEKSKVGERRSNEDYLQEVWDSLAVAWDKDKFNMGKGYDSEYECECITITSKDNEEVRAKIYVDDYNGRHPVAFKVVYRYPGDKGVGVMGTYEFQSTDMDGLGEEVFDYFDEIKDKVGESTEFVDLSDKVGESKKSSEISEGWTGGFTSRQEILDLMDGGIFTDDWKLEKKFGNWGCYTNQKTGRPIVLQLMIQPSRDGDWTYKAVTSDMGPADTNIQAAKWLKPRLDKWASEDPKNAESVTDYEWDWIEKSLGKEAYNKARKDAVKSLVAGDKVKLIDSVANGAVVEFVRMLTPSKMLVNYNGREMGCKTAFIDHKIGDTAEAKQNEDGDNADVYTIDLTRISSDGNEDGIDDMQAAQNFYDEDEAIQAAKDLADSYKDDDDVVQVTVLAGQYETPRGIFGEPFDIFTASSSNSMTTAEYRKKANYVKTTGLDYYANGGKSEGSDDGKGCKGKDCKDDESKKSESDETSWALEYLVETAKEKGLKVTTESPTEICITIGTFPMQDHIFVTDDAPGKDDTSLELYVPAAHINTSGLTLQDVLDYLDDPIGKRDAVQFKNGNRSGKVEAKKSEGLPPKKLGSNRQYRSRADLINKMKALGAVEITTPAQFNDIHSKQWLHTAGYAMDINGNLIGQTYFGDKDGKWYYATTKTFQGDYLPECKEAKKSEKATVTCSICGNPTDDPIWGEGNRAFCKDCYSDGDDFKHGKTKFVVGMMISLDGVKQYIRELKPRTFVGQSVDTGKEFSLPISSLNRASILYDPRNESKKSESLTLKQKELKDMARYGQAEDITTISDAEAKELKKKGIETVGISRGVYGMNGALLRDNEGNKYVITARSSNLFYFV